MNLETRVRLSLRPFDMACGAVIAVAALYFIRSVLRGAQEKPEKWGAAAARAFFDTPVNVAGTLDQAYTTMYDSPDGTLDKWVR